MVAGNDQKISGFLQDHFWNLDKTEFRIPPKLTIQIWDNDKFSLDDYLGKTAMLLTPFCALTNMQREGLENLLCRTTIVCQRQLFPIYISVTGSVELDLLSLIPPAKSPEKCSLKMLPGMTNSASSKKPLPNSIFSQKSVRGWWPCVNEQDGKQVLGVCFFLSTAPS